MIRKKEEQKMKKAMNKIYSMALLIMAGGALAGCSNDDDFAVSSTTPTGKGYTMTVDATKGSDITSKALADAGATLTATWEENDKVEVYSQDGTILYGTLLAQGSGATATLKGELTTVPGESETLLLKYLSDSYTSQDGTLTGNETSIDKTCAYATASVTVSKVSETEKTITTTSANFENQQAIVKFTLSDGTNAISASELVVKVGDDEYTATLASAASTVYVALPGFTNKDISLRATVGTTTYTYSRTGVSFYNGKFSRVNVKMSQAITGYSLADATVGMIVGSNGLAYNVTDKDNLPSGVNAVAVVAYVGTAGSVDTSSTSYKGLALALTDANNGNTCAWYTTNSGTCVSQNTDITIALGYKDGISCTNTLTSDGHTHAAAKAAKNYSVKAPSGTSGWFLPSIGQWNLIVNGLTSTTAAFPKGTGTTADYNLAASKFNSKITDAGGTALKNAYASYYWASTGAGAGTAWFYSTYYGRAYIAAKPNGNYVRACFAF